MKDRPRRDKVSAGETRNPNVLSQIIKGLPRRAHAFGFVPQGEGVLRVRLPGLTVGMSCSVLSRTVAVENGETVVSPWKTFRTLNPLAEKTHFVMSNDTHIHDQTIQALHETTPVGEPEPHQRFGCGMHEPSESTPHLTPAMRIRNSSSSLYP